MKKLLFPLLMILISFGLIIGCSGGGGGGSTGSDNSNLTVSTMEIKGKFNVSNSSATPDNYQPGPALPSRLALPKNPVALLNDLKNKKVVAQSPMDAYGNFVFYGDFRELTLSISIASTDTEIIIGSVPSNMPLNSRILVSYPYDNTGGFDEYAVITSNIIKCKNLVDSIKIDRYNSSKCLWDMVDALKPEIQAYIAANPSKNLSTLITETVSASSPATMAITSKINLPAGEFDHFYMTTDSPKVAGSPITLTIYAKDANESTVTNYAGTGTMIVSNPAGTISWMGNGLSNAGNGAASYSSITFSKGIASIHVTSSSTDISRAFTITDSTTSKYASTTLTWNVNTSQIFDHFTVTSNSPQSMNSFVILTITAKNSTDGLVNTYAGTGTLAISSPSGTITWSGTGVSAGTNGSATFTSTTFVNGAASIQVKSSVTESAKTLTITDTASGKSSTTTISWINDILDHFAISTISSPQSAGIPFLITITALNSSNETIPNFSGTASLSDTTNTITPNTTGAFSNGVWSGNVTIASVASNVTIIASSNSKVGASNPVTLNKALLSISLAKTSDVALVNSSYDLSKVKVTAQYSDSTSSDVAASWSIQAGGGSISGSSYVTPASAGVSLLTASYTDGGVTKTATLVLDVLSSLKVASPVFAPASSTAFTTSQSVTISCATAGASIKYTIDGSTPSASNGIAYSGAITLSSTTTIKAIAYKSGLTDSDIVSATYLISQPVTNDFTFSDNGSDITITGYSGAGGSAIIPNKINNKPVTNIGDNAFTSVLSLTSISIPASITNIGYGVFLGCSNLTAINVDAANPNYSSDSNGVLYNKNKTTIIQFPCGRSSAFTVPEGISKIAEYSFYYCQHLTSITIPNTVTIIGRNAFYKCNSLTTINIPASVTSIGNQAFMDCSSLTAINVDTANPNYSSDSNGVLYNKNKTTIIQFPCGRSGTFTIPSTVSSISQSAFSYCNLTSITISSTVTSLLSGAFSYCKGLTSITIPNSVNNIETGAFMNCNNLISAYFNGNAPSTFGTNVFTGCAADFKIYYHVGNTGWSNPWNDYATGTF